MNKILEKEWDEIKRDLKTLGKKIETKSRVRSNLSSNVTTPSNSNNADMNWKSFMKDIMKIKPS